MSQEIGKAGSPLEIVLFEETLPSPTETNSLTPPEQQVPVFDGIKIKRPTPPIENPEDKNIPPRKGREKKPLTPVQKFLKEEVGIDQRDFRRGLLQAMKSNQLGQEGPVLPLPVEDLETVDAPLLSEKEINAILASQTMAEIGDFLQAKIQKKEKEEEKGHKAAEIKAENRKGIMTYLSKWYEKNKEGANEAVLKYVAEKFLDEIFSGLKTLITNVSADKRKEFFVEWLGENFSFLADLSPELIKIFADQLNSVIGGADVMLLIDILNWKNLNTVKKVALVAKINVRMVVWGTVLLALFTTGVEVAVNKPSGQRKEEIPAKEFYTVQKRQPPPTCVGAKCVNGPISFKSPESQQSVQSFESAFRDGLLITKNKTGVIEHLKIVLKVAAERGDRSQEFKNLIEEIIAQLDLLSDDKKDFKIFLRAIREVNPGLIAANRVQLGQQIILPRKGEANFGRNSSLAVIALIDNLEKLYYLCLQR